MKKYYYFSKCIVSKNNWVTKGEHRQEVGRFGVSIEILV